MAEHRATQEANPARAMWRTVLQVGVPAFLGLLVLLPVVIDTILNSPLAAYLTPEVFAWLAGFAALITAAAATFARIMAIPGVNDWLRKYVRFFAPDHQPVYKNENTITGSVVEDPGRDVPPRV